MIHIRDTNRTTATVTEPEHGAIQWTFIWNRPSSPKDCSRSLAMSRLVLILFCSRLSRSYSSPAHTTQLQQEQLNFKTSREQENKWTADMTARLNQNLITTFGIVSKFCCAVTASSPPPEIWMEIPFSSSAIPRWYQPTACCLSPDNNTSTLWHHPSRTNWVSSEERSCCAQRPSLSSSPQRSWFTPE